MRFSAASVVAGAAVASAGLHPAVSQFDSTVYSTNVVTITSCGPTVTNCPAESTVVSSTVIPFTTSTVYATTTYTISKCPETVTKCPYDSTVVVTETIPVSTTVCPVSEAVAVPTGGSWGPYPSKNSTSPFPPKGDHSDHPVPTKVPTKGPEVCVPSKSVKTISTSITTVIPTVIYETVDVPCPTAYVPVPTGAWPGKPSNGTVKPPTPITAGAASTSGSFILAAAAGLVAVFML